MPSMKRPSGPSGLSTIELNVLAGHSERSHATPSRSPKRFGLPSIGRSSINLLSELTSKRCARHALRDQPTDRLPCASVRPQLRTTPLVFPQLESPQAETRVHLAGGGRGD
eukprot:6932829-Prymnesium_polylepis.3